MSRYDFLPGVLAEIAEVGGLDAALKIAERRGGARMSVPAQLSEDHWLVELLGLDTARRLSEHFTSGKTSQEFEVPLGPTGSRRQLQAAIRRLIAEGNIAGDEIARRLRIAGRTVRRHKNALRHQDRRQGRLL